MQGQTNKQFKQKLKLNTNLKYVTNRKAWTDKTLETCGNFLCNGKNAKTNHKNLSLTKSNEIATHCNDNSNRSTNESLGPMNSIRKIKDLRATPKKNEILKEIKVEDTSRPQIFSPSSLNLNLIKHCSKSLNNSQESPIPRKRETYHLYANDTSQKQKQRKLSTDDVYDQLSDMSISDLYNNDLSDVEAIDMLHDLDSVMEFEESKVSAGFLCSTANDNVHTEHGTEISESPKIDPLILITDNYKIPKETKHKRDQAKSYKRNSKACRKKVQECYENKKEVINNSKSRRKRACSNKGIDDSHDVIKDLLGELDIDFKIEDTINENEDTMNENEDTINENEDDDEDKIPDQEIKRLYDLEVHLIHQVPQQHMIEHTAGSKTLTILERKKFLKYGPLKRGAFTSSEDKIIKNNWIAFCKKHNWNSKYIQPFLHIKATNKFYIRSLEERQKFSQFLANGLPWRTLYSVYHRFRHLYGNHERSFKRYTDSEDEQILVHIKDNENKRETHKTFSALGKMLGRTSHSVWLRYQSLKKIKHKGRKKSSSEVQWTLPFIGKFISVFMDVTLCKNVSELKDAIVPKAVWQKLEDKLDIDYNVLKKYWAHQLHMQLFCPEPIYLNDIKIKLIEYVYGKGIASTREVVWPSVAKFFDGVTSIFLCKIFVYLVEEATVKIGTNSFPAIAEYLYHEKIQDIRNESSDKFLPRLSYNNGDVKIIYEDMHGDI